MCRANVVEAIDDMQMACDLETALKLLVSRGVDGKELTTAINQVRDRNDLFKAIQTLALKARAPEHPLPPAPAIIEAPRVSIPMSPRTPSIVPAPVERVADSPLRSTTPAPVVTLSAGLFTLPPPPSAPAEQRPVAPVAPIAPSATTTAASASRGISLDVALQRLDATDDRDAVVEVMLDHAYERFAYVALLMVHGDHCAGVASRGDGVSGAALRELTITLQRPSILRLAHDSSAVEIASIEDGTSDAEVRARLQRREATEAVVVPLRIGSKVALLLWADNGAASSSAGSFEIASVRLRLCGPGKCLNTASTPRSP